MPVRRSHVIEGPPCPQCGAVHWTFDIAASFDKETGKLDLKPIEPVQCTKCGYRIESSDNVDDETRRAAAAIDEAEARRVAAQDEMKEALDRAERERAEQDRLAAENAERDAAAAAAMESNGGPSGATPGSADAPTPGGDDPSGKSGSGDIDASGNDTAARVLDDKGGDDLAAPSPEPVNEQRSLDDSAAVLTGDEGEPEKSDTPPATPKSGRSGGSSRRR